MSASMSSRKAVAAVPTRESSLVEAKEVQVETFLAIFIFAVGVILLSVAAETGSVLALIPGLLGVVGGVVYCISQLFRAMRGDK